MENFNGTEITRKALQYLKEAGADKAVASLARSEKSELNVDAGNMSLYRTTVNVSIGLTAFCENAKGSSSINSYDNDSLKKAAQNAVTMAKASKSDPCNDISPEHKLEVFEFGDKSPNSEKMYERLREFIDYSKKQYPTTKLEQSILDFTRSSSFYSNSNGAEFAEHCGLYNFFAMFTSKEGEKASSFNYSGASHQKLDLELKDWGMVDTLMKQSTEQTNIQSIDGAFTGDIIITPDCLGDFHSYLDSVYMSDYSIITSSSPWKDKLGQKVISDLITIKSEPEYPSRIETAYGYTSDGFKACNCTLIDKGVLNYFTLGLYGSKKSGKARCPSGGGAIIIEPGKTKLEDMIKDVKKGIILARFSGGSPSDNGDFSGVAKNSYLVENGKIIRPISETMIAGNVAQLFSNVRAVSIENVDYGTAIVPYILSSGVSISGK